MLDFWSERTYNNENEEKIMRFSIGQTVTVRTKWRSNILGQDFDENVFTGTVVPNPKWLDHDYVSIRTGKVEYPISYIHKKFIVGHEFSESRSEERIFQVTSKSSGKMYNVISANGDVTCDCIGFQFRRKCKHSEAVKKVLVLDNTNA